MRKVCAWCGETLKPAPGDGPDGSPVTHGICEACAQDMLAGTRTSARQFLESLNEPVFLVDADVRVRAANGAARALVGKERHDVEDHLGGDVIECANARLPGGCGRTVHCKACTIRTSVTATIETGRAVANIPAFQDIRSGEGVVQKRLLVSTERAGAFVLLRIEEDHAANLIAEA